MTRDSGDDDEGTGLGPCCICETRFGVRNIVMLDRRAPIAGHGWGCVVCALPTDGAVVVFCDPCKEAFDASGVATFACRGYPRSEGRIPFAELPAEVFEHNDEAHREDD